MLSWLYGNIVEARNVLFEKGIFEAFDLGARTISVGNITTGGTGKTPLVSYVAEVLARGGERVAILSRGYGRADPRNRVLVSEGSAVLATPEEAGDEPVELARKLAGKAIVVADADRVSAAEWVARRFRPTVFLLDDGFQHRRVRRDLDLVCIDATNPFGGKKTLPFGRLREPLHNLSRADAIVITRANLSQDLADLKSEILNLNPHAPLFCAEMRIERLVGLEAGSLRLGNPDIESLKGNRVFAFCGLGNPAAFYDQMRTQGLNVVGRLDFRDHYAYTQDDVDEIERRAAQANAGILLTTAKDAVKLEGLKFRLTCYVVEIGMKLDDPEGFAALLTAS